MCVKIKIYYSGKKEIARMKNEQYFLGIDGGGTKTAFRLVDAHGRIVQETLKGAGNPNDIGMENAEALLREGITETVGAIPFEKITLFAGISGGGLTGDHAERLRRFFGKFGFFAFDNGSDMENLVGLSPYDRAVLVIMGTGFIVYALNGEERKRISGWGHLFDEGGSGYAIGRDAIAAVLSAWDGSGDSTALTALMTEKLGGTAEAHLTEFYTGGKTHIASFADLVFIAAEKGDTVAETILRKNAAFAADKISAALCSFGTQEEIPVLFAGGISEKYEVLFPLIAENLSDGNFRLLKIREKPIEGAVRRAEKIYERKLRGEKL
jgi:N-acetylglucosamine kinase-like BadF-type ATPase